MKTDGLVLQIGSEPAGRLVEATADVHRLRVLLEGAFDVLSGPAGVLTPSLEVGGRYDGGAAETGAGLEVGGGVRYAYPAWGLTVAANGRVLLTHQASGPWIQGVGCRGVAAGGAGVGGPWAVAHAEQRLGKHVEPRRATVVAGGGSTGGHRGQAERRETGATPEHGVSLSGTVSW